MKGMMTTLGLLAAVALAGCTGENFEEYTGQDEPPPASGPPQTGEVPGQAAPGMSGDEGLPSNRALAVHESEGTGTYLTDQAGRPLYVLDRDRQGEPTCHDVCSKHWPPFLAEPHPPDAMDDAVREDLIAAVPRDEGTRQTAYAGHPLYYFNEDQEPGQTTGHGLQDEWGTWSLIGTDGQPLHQAGGS